MGLTPRMLRLTTRQLGLSMVVLNAVGVRGVALNASVGLMPTVTGIFATTWVVLARPRPPNATALTTAMGTEDLMCSERGQWGL